MYFEKSLTASDIAVVIDGEVLGNKDLKITNINNIEDAGEDCLTFCGSRQYVKYLLTTPAPCVIINRNYRQDFALEELPQGKTYILTDNAYKGFVQLLMYFNSLKPAHSPGIDKTARVGANSIIAPSAHIGPNCTVGNNCLIEDGVVLKANVVLYDNVKVGRNTLMHANVVCAEGVVVGEHCTIHPGAVIGSDGFGFVENPDGSYTKIPQLGNAVVGNNVELGANTTIDRAVVGSTIIEDGVILDNLVHIAHNVKVGRNTAMAAQTGISGSTKVGKRNRFGGQVGLAGHIETADDVVILAQSGVPKSVPEKGIYFGSPLKDRMKAFKIEAVINNLPEIYKDLAEMKKKLEKQ